MIKIIQKIAVVGCFWALTVLGESFTTPLIAQIPDSLFQKDTLVILVTDSGLGGLAVCGDIERRATLEHPFKYISVIFCNALPESDYGYNNMTTREEKIQVFSSALSGMTAWYHPDIILIACNTLSVIYSETEFSKTAKIPVVSIVDLGAKMMFKKLESDTASTAILFGTETTIEEDSHRRWLLNRGISPSRIIVQSCPDLAGEIQADASSDAVKTMIEFYADDAVQKLPGNSKHIYAGLFCTHYGYAAKDFISSLTKETERMVDIVDPTIKMSDVVYLQRFKKKFSKMNVSVQVISRAVITHEEIRSIGNLLKAASPKTAQALRQYQLKKNLFSFSR